MQDAKHTQSVDGGKKKLYETPALIEFGLVRDITKGTGSVGNDGFGGYNQTMGGMGMGGM